MKTQKLLELLGRVAIGIIIGAFILNSRAQAQEQEEVITELGTVETVSKPPTHYINDILEPYFINYAIAMKQDGWDIKGIFEKDVFIVFDYEAGKNFSEGEFTPAGIALGMFDDDVVYVVISVDAWLSLPEYGKQDLLNHELMHDIFNVEHTHREEEDKLMHPSSYPKNWGETMARLFGAIKDLNIANGY